MNARVIALVVDAGPPASRLSRWSDAGKGTVTILADLGTGRPIHVARSLRLTEDRWLVPGMEIPVSIDPAAPERFEVEWDAVPTIEARVAANDPTLADPAATKRRIAAALESAGVSGPAAGVPIGGMAGGVGVQAPGERGSDRLDDAIEAAAQKPAPPGKQRAVVVVATATVTGDGSPGFVVDPNTNGPP
jgi:hypothetical protein